MIKTYIRLAMRGLMKNRIFSFINIFGLAIGLTCCLLITLYIYHELSYDTHQKQRNRLYQVGTLAVIDGKAERYGTTPAPLAKAMQQEYPEVEKVARLMPALEDDKTLFQYTEGGTIKSFYEDKGYLADSSFFELFTYQFKEGNPTIALKDPNSIVISDDIAYKLFGNTLALNKIIHINSATNGSYDFKVTGVFVPATTPSHIDARFFMSMEGGDVAPWVSSLNDMVNNNLFYTYLLLKPGTDANKLQSKFDAFINKYARADLKASGRDRKQYLTAVQDIHLFANDKRNVSESGNLTSLYILASIALVTLLIACVNFMNLSTARSSKRAVEIGVRKVLGAEKTVLIKQFLWEAILLAVISFIFSLALTGALLPLFERVSGKQFAFSSSQYSLLVLGFLVVTILTGFIAGVYPAFYLSAFKPVKVLKGKLSNSLAAISLRKALVVFQFVISVALIVASVTISNQMHYLRNKDLGFEKDQQVVIPLRTTTAKSAYAALKNEVVASPAIAGAGASLYYPGIANVMDWLLYKQGTPPDQTKDIYINYVDDSYLHNLAIKPVAGRLFSKDFPADTSNRMIINEQAVKLFGFASAEDAIGKSLVMMWNGTESLFPIVGVVKDFHFKELRSEIQAYGFLLSRSQNYNYLIAHAKGGTIKPALAAISSAWKKVNPNEPFEYSFMDDDFQKNYFAEERLAAIIRYFTIVAIFISCLGLFGLTTFSVEQRTKEIGIRKVLGASIPGLVTLLSKDFLKLVVLSFFIASPIAWYFMNSWLQNFAYKTPFTIWMVVVSWGIALLIAFLTISIQAIKAALTNPVKNLRTE
ncbi:ABC transporter permease [Flavisolibacter tropicus]|uniref:Macrolide ABC transporter permease n=1 Tax=Flavisolibacter tropicus TaxID=1492898 RepID=A0A172U2B7_9BACT|nr:ABC transporter permease [Flavisolibacter tropicus]ANE53163.1 macrolide ABC transporter permease [Flavisolibacter tropicus]